MTPIHALTSSQQIVLRTKQHQAEASQLKYWEIYEWLADTMEQNGVSKLDKTILWLRGATEANANRGTMASIIRQYSAIQHRLRYGYAPDEAAMQKRLMQLR